MLRIPTPPPPRRRVLAPVGQQASGPVTAVAPQTRHRGCDRRGIVDCSLRLADGGRPEVENRIDAGCSLARSGAARAPFMTQREGVDRTLSTAVRPVRRWNGSEGETRTPPREGSA